MQRPLPSPGPRSSSTPLYLALAGAGVVVLAIIASVVVVAVGRREDAWERENRARIVAMKSEADSLAVAGRLKEAHEQYQAISEIVAGREIKNPALKDDVANAAAAQARVFDMLLTAARAKSLADEAKARANAVAQPAKPKAAARPQADPPERVTVVPPRADPPVYVTEPVRPQPPPVSQPVVIAPPSPEAVGPPVPVEPRPARPVRPIVRSAVVDRGEVTDEEIGQAIQKGAEFLVGQFENSRLKDKSDPELAGVAGCAEGIHALCVYALLQTGQAIPDERLDVRGTFMKGLISVMKEMAMENRAGVYSRGIRATALGVYNRPEDREALKLDVECLVATARGGGYTYSVTIPDKAGKVPVRPNPRAPAVPVRPGRAGGGAAGGAGGGGLFGGGGGAVAPDIGGLPRSVRGYGDLSNSQYGLLGVWSGAEIGMEVPPQYWQEVDDHWTSQQTAEGQWAYPGGNTGKGTFSMTCAGLASLFVTHDYIDAPKFGAQVGRDPYSPAVAKALAWLEEGDNSVDVTNGAWYTGYNLYGLERVGLASGFKYFGTHDWYRELARVVVDSQNADGSWTGLQVRRTGRIMRVGRGGGDALLIDTAYTLLFLARGRHPILMNKLRFDGSWANRPRDAANLARFASRELERPLNWQVVSLQKDYSDWLDSSILYLASHQAPKLADADIDKLRNYVQAGGLLFTQADGDNAAFNRFAMDLGKKLFPNYEMRDLPADHPIYSLVYKINPRPVLRAISNDSRLLMVHSPTDISINWQMRQDKTKRPIFELGANLFVYASGKSDFRNRINSPYVAPPAAKPQQTLRIARVKYAGNWDPEPGAWPRFGNWFARQTGVGLEVSTVDASNLKPGDAVVAHLTGTVVTTLPEADVAALRAFVQAGGVLLIDPCGGAAAFHQSARTTLMRALAPDLFLKMLTAPHPLLAATEPGREDLSKKTAKYRPYTRQKLGAAPGEVEIASLGKGYIILSNLDLSTGLVAANTWGVLGYHPDYAQAFTRNVILWSAAAK